MTRPLLNRSPCPQIEEVLALETEGSAKHAELSAELKERQKKLDELMETFAVSLGRRVVAWPGCG